MTKRKGKPVDEMPQGEPGATIEAQDTPIVADSEPVRIDSEPEPEVMATVKLLNTDVFDGCYLVYDAASGEGYLVPTSELHYSMGEQALPRRVLEATKQPYDWKDEIDRLVVDRQTIQQALWRSGLVAPQPMNFRAFVARLLMHGTLPVVEGKDAILRR